MKKKFDFGKKMESFTDEQLRERIEAAYNYEMPKLRIVPYIGEDNNITTYDIGEVVARCPVTGIVDLYRVVVDFIPDQGLPELKTYKYYLMAYVDLPISHEHLTSKIYKEFKEQVKPLELLVRVLTNVRGGIYTSNSIGDRDIATDLKMRAVNG